MSVVSAIVQARMGSSRLPGKSLAPLGEISVLDWVLDRVALSTRVDDVIVATTRMPEDDPIADHLSARDVTCVRGSSDDVLSRYVLAAQLTDAATLVRITADCPFVDPGIIDATVDAVQGNFPVDYASTSLAGHYPRGLDVEAFSTAALEKAHKHAVEPDEREHVTLHIYRHPGDFVVTAVPAPKWAQRPDLRFTIDESADLELARAAVDGLQATPATLRTIELIQFLDSHPEIRSLNEAVEHRNFV